MASEESANFYRISSLILDIGTSLLMRILKNKIQPLTLDKFLQQPAIKADLRRLNHKKILDCNQFLIVSSVPVCEDKFDISLIVKLLLNVCPNVVPPGTHWDNNPPDHDLSLVADLNRLRNIRNSRPMLAHGSRAKLTKVEFTDIWAKVKEILIRRSIEIGETGGVVEKEINDLIERKLDPSKLEDNCQKMMAVWKKWRKDDKRMLSSIENSLEILHEKMDRNQKSKRIKELHLEFNANLMNQGIAKITPDKDLSPEQKLQGLFEHKERFNEMVGNQVAVDSDPPKNLKELLNHKGKITVTSSLQLKILSTKEPIPYKNHRGDACMKRVKVADGTAYTEAIAYDSHIYELLDENEAIIVSGIIKRSDGTLVFTSWTDAYATSSKIVKVPEEIQQEATSIKLVNLADASISAPNTIVTVQGKVVEAQTTSIKRLSTGEEVSFKSIILKDHSGTMDVTLWRELAIDEVAKGAHVQLEDFYVTSRNKTRNIKIPILSNQKGKNSSIQFISVPDFDDLSSDCSDFEETSSCKKSGQLIGLKPVISYRSCTNPKCKKKKLEEPDMICPTCFQQHSDSSAATGIVCKFLIQSDDVKEYTLFKQDLIHFLESAAIPIKRKIISEIKQEIIKHETMSKIKHEVMSKIIEKLPIEVNFIVDQDGEILRLLEADTSSGE